MLRFPALNTFLQSFLCTWSSFRGVGGKFWFWCVDFGSDVWIKALKAQVAVVPMEGLCPPGQKAHSYSVDPIDYFSFRGKKKQQNQKQNQETTVCNQEAFPGFCCLRSCSWCDAHTWLGRGASWWSSAVCWVSGCCGRALVSAGRFSNEHWAVCACADWEEVLALWCCFLAVMCGIGQWRRSCTFLLWKFWGHMSVSCICSCNHLIPENKYNLQSC